jgi:hypothetical protein
LGSHLPAQNREAPYKLVRGSNMISSEKKFLFIHVPKTGGNSIQNILKDYSEDKIVTKEKYQDGVERFGIRNEECNFAKHSSLSHYKKILDKETYYGLFKFATIRNPWDMMISHYFSFHRGVKQWNRKSFTKLVNKVKLLRYYITERYIFLDVLDKIKKKNILSKKKLDADIDFIMRFENLDDDFKLLCEKIDIPYKPLLKRNISINKRQHYSYYYDEELKEMVRSKFIEEIDFGGYEFENV